MIGLLHALTRNSASTRPDHPDPSLRGRRYAVPFDRVWRAALTLADSELRGWRIVDADDIAGRLECKAQTLVFRLIDDVTVQIGLDEDAQTRVDVTSSSRKGRGDLGTNARRIRRFLRRLDRAIEL